MKTAERIRMKVALAPPQRAIDYLRRDPIGSLYFLWLTTLVTGYLWMVCQSG